MKKKLAILGSTGSIGVSTLEVVAQFPDRFEVVSLAAQRNIDRLEAQIRQFQPQIVSVADEARAQVLRARCADVPVEIYAGEMGAIQVATHPAADLVVSAIVGFAGLAPTYQAILARKDLALANKETLVVAGALMMPEIKKQGVALLPVDSEHNAIFQALQGQRRADVRKIILTCSGGPFRTFSLADLQTVTAAQALRHPNWAMGPKITIDSATLMNKGLEVIEAHWLFDVAFADIEVVVHPQSVVHSLVEYVDGSLLAELGVSDMKIPIAYALAYPERVSVAVPRLKLATLHTVMFEEPDLKKFPCLQYGYEAGQIGGTMPAVLNAANEIAVDKFLQGQIAFTAIPRVIRHVMDQHAVQAVTSLNILCEVDRWARQAASAWLA